MINNKFQSNNMPKKRPCKEEKEHYSKVAQLPCYVWANFPKKRKECCAKLEIHHKTGAGMAKKSHFELTMPLCFNHHSAQTPLPFGSSIHKGTKTFQENIATQDAMIFWTQQQITENCYE